MSDQVRSARKPGAILPIGDRDAPLRRPARVRGDVRPPGWPGIGIAHGGRASRHCQHTNMFWRPSSCIVRSLSDSPPVELACRRSAGCRMFILNCPCGLSRRRRRYGQEIDSRAQARPMGEVEARVERALCGYPAIERDHYNHAGRVSAH